MPDNQPSHPNEFKAIEAALQQARPAVDAESQARIAYAAGYAAGSQVGSNSRARSSRHNSAGIWQVVSLALAGCVAFLLTNSTWFANENASTPNNPVAMAEESPQQPEFDTDRKRPERRNGMMTADWRTFDDNDPVLTLPNSEIESSTSFDPALKPTSITQLIDSI